MYDILEKLFDKLANAFLTNVDVSVKLGVIGAILLLVLFLKQIAFRHKYNGRLHW